MRRSADERTIVGDRPAPVDGLGTDETTELYRLSYEEGTGIIHTLVCGFWSVDDTDRYFEHLGRYIEAGRKKRGFVSVLVDRRGNPVQSPDVALRMQKANQSLYRAEDRLAILVDSNLVKMQLRRLFTHPGSKAFLSYDAAVAWLQRRS